MSVRAIFEALPVVQRLRARDDFVATTVVSLRRWNQLEEASWWCERHWRDYDRQYRRRVRLADCQATFEFPSTPDAAAFLLKFGASATRC